ncbi:MAG: flagellar basal-body MS-ring/collar protein FliF [Erythrobacter sp.]
MAEVAASISPDSSALVPQGAPAPADWISRLPQPLAGLVGQPAVRRALPALAGVGALALTGALYLALAQGPQRVLYASLTDAERAKVTETLSASGIAYNIDNGTGAITVAEDDIYRARMLVASNAGIAAPEGASEMLDAIPLGSSRTLEGERLRLARERELVLTIREIDGIEAVRVHLATPERSVFVRDASAPSASVMVRLASGRSLSQSQVEAIVNLVAASVPGMTSDQVRVVDQNGRLLSSPRETGAEALSLQREFEAKLVSQIDALLLPLLGEGNYTAQVQAELDPEEVTRARETYDNPGVVRSETQRNATRTGQSVPGGVPGVPANTPPPDPTLENGAPQPTPPAQASASDTESAVQRSYELGREVAVTNRRPGGLTKLSVAVAVSDEALKAAAPLTAARLQTLVSAAVGANAQRGDMVEVVPSKFGPADLAQPAFHEQPWFMAVVRYGAMLLAVLLVLLLAVRPWLVRLRERDKAAAAAAGEERAQFALSLERDDAAPAPEPGSTASLAAAPQVDLPQQVALAREFAARQPDRAALALQRMLQAPPAPVEAPAGATS